VHCHFSQQVWHRLRSWASAAFPIPGQSFHSTEEWWLAARQKAPKNLQRDFDTVAILAHWRLWKERNARTFQREENSVDRVFELIIEDIHVWRAAGCIVNM
jgi:hypothetical protein